MAHLNIVVEDQVVVAIPVQQRQRALDAKVLKLQHGFRVALRDGRDELVHEFEVGHAREAGLLEAGIKGVLAQLGVVGADVEDDGQDARGVEAPRGHV